MKTLYVGLVIILLGILVLGGCGSKTAAPPPTTAAAVTTTSQQAGSTTTTAVQPKPQYGGTLRIIDDRPPGGTLGWFAEPGPPSGMWYFTMFEGLVRPQYSGEIKPLLASGWVIANDLTSVTFTLRENVKFHDGSDFDAAAAKWNFDVFISAKMASVKDVSLVEAIGNYTLKVNLKQYYNTVLYSLSSVPMVSKVSFDAKGKDWLRWNPVGTGPFKFVSYTPDTVIKAARFAGYWQTGRPYLEAVEVSWVADPMTAAASFEAGEADAVTGNSPQIMNDLKRKGHAIITGFTGAITLIPDSKNTDSPLAKLKVRQAIDYAIDREALVKAKGYGMWATTYQFAAPDASAYVTNLNVRKYDPEKARQLLAEAGYPNGLSMTLFGDGSSTDKDSVVAIQGFLSKVGITAKLDWLDYMGFVKYVMGGWTNGMLVCANGFAPNLNSAADFVWSQTAMFFPSVAKTDEMEKLLIAAKAPRDYDPAFVKIYLQKMHDDAMFLPIYCIIRGMAANPKVHDTGYLQGYGPYTWNPVEAWKSQ